MSKNEVKSLTKTTTWKTDRTDTEVLTLSCLMRIADALETLTKRYDDLERGVKFKICFRYEDSQDF